MYIPTLLWAGIANCNPEFTIFSVDDTETQKLSDIENDDEDDDYVR